MIPKYLIQLYLLNFLFAICLAFSPNKISYLSRKNTQIFSDYKSQLEAARLKKLGGATSTPAKIVREKPQTFDSSPSRNSNGLPFDDKLYDHMKYVIEKITFRMKNPKVLTPEELVKLEMSIDAIIRDAKIHQSGSRVPENKPSPSPSPSAPRVPENSTKNADGAVSLAGMSSWVIPGMESMNQEEYYSALNKRIADMKQKRAEAGEVTGPRSRDMYEESLNKRNRSS